MAASKTISEEQFVTFVGKFDWFDYAKNCMVTFVFPQGLKENCTALAYWQWDKDSDGKHSLATMQGSIFILKDSYIRFFNADANYYYFDGTVIVEGETASMDLRMHNPGGESSSEFKATLNYKK